ncbi:MAG: DNA repair protein RecO [Pseudomonadota bacterium]|jgi:DNA repair protein RecO
MSETNLPYDQQLENLSKGRDISVSAIVLRARPYRDSDLMAQLLTPSMGKISVIGRHARGSKRRFPSSLDLFDRGLARIGREKNGSLSVKEFTPSHSLTRVREDLDKLTLASLLCESFDLVLQENTGESSAEIFEVLDLALNAIDESLELKTSFRATLVALTELTKREGISDLTKYPPGSGVLRAALDAIERFTERRLLTRESIEALINRLRSKEAGNS